MSELFVDSLPSPVIVYDETIGELELTELKKKSSTTRFISMKSLEIEEREEPVEERQTTVKKTLRVAKGALKHLANSFLNPINASLAWSGKMLILSGSTHGNVPLVAIGTGLYVLSWPNYNPYIKKTYRVAKKALQQSPQCSSDGSWIELTPIPKQAV